MYGENWDTTEGEQPPTDQGVKLHLRCRRRPWARDPGSDDDDRSDGKNLALDETRDGSRIIAIVRVLTAPASGVVCRLFEQLRCSRIGEPHVAARRCRCRVVVLFDPSPESGPRREQVSVLPFGERTVYSGTEPGRASAPSRLSARAASRSNHCTARSGSERGSRSRPSARSLQLRLTFKSEESP